MRANMRRSSGYFQRLMLPMLPQLLEWVDGLTSVQQAQGDQRRRHHYLHLMLWSAVTVFGVMSGFVLLIRSPEASTNPFSTYMEWLQPGIDADKFNGFSCEPGDRSATDRCIYRGQGDEAFDVIVAVPYGRVEQINMKARTEDILLGNLIAIWGRPMVQRQLHFTTFSWPRDHITATSRVTTDDLNYFVPIEQIVLYRDPITG
jgi:hypothetical protein